MNKTARMVQDTLSLENNKYFSIQFPSRITPNDLSDIRELLELFNRKLPRFLEDEMEQT